MTVDNTNLFSFKGAISRKNYFINFIIICAISTLLIIGLKFLLSFFLLPIIKLSMKYSFISSKIFTKIIICLSAIFSCTLLTFNIKKRIFDIKNGINTKALTILFSIISAFYSFSAFIPKSPFSKYINLILLLSILSLTFIKGKIIAIKETTKDENSDNSYMLSSKGGISPKNFVTNNFFILGITGHLWALQYANNYYYDVSQYFIHILNLIAFGLLFSFNIKKRFFDIKNGENYIKPTILISILGVLTLASILFNLHSGIIYTLITFLFMNIIYLSVKEGKYVTNKESKGFNIVAFLCPWLWAIFNRIKEPLYILPIFTANTIFIYLSFMLWFKLFGFPEALFLNKGIICFLYFIAATSIIQVYYGIKANEWFDIEYKNEDKKQKKLLPMILIIISLFFIVIEPAMFKINTIKQQIEFNYKSTKDAKEKGIYMKELTLKNFEKEMKRNNLKTWEDLRKYEERNLQKFLTANELLEPTYKKEGNTYKFYIKPEIYNSTYITFLSKLYLLAASINQYYIAQIEKINTKKYIWDWNMPYKAVYYSTVDNEVLVDCNLHTVYYDKKPNYIDAYKAMKSCKMKNYTKNYDIKEGINKEFNFTKK